MVRSVDDVLVPSVLLMEDDDVTVCETSLQQLLCVMFMLYKALLKRESILEATGTGNNCQRNIWVILSLITLITLELRSLFGISRLSTKSTRSPGYFCSVVETPNVPVFEFQTPTGSMQCCLYGQRVLSIVLSI